MRIFGVPSEVWQEAGLVYYMASDKSTGRPSVELIPLQRLTGT